MQSGIVLALDTKAAGKSEDKAVLEFSRYYHRWNSIMKFGYFFLYVFSLTYGEDLILEEQARESLAAAMSLSDIITY